MFRFLKNVFKTWNNCDPFLQSAATAYYALFSLPGLLIIIIAVASQFISKDIVETEVIDHITHTLGTDSAESIKTIIARSNTQGQGLWALTAGLMTLAFGATGLFIQIQHSLNRIWNVEVKKSAGFMTFFKNRAASFGIVVIIGFLLLVSLTITALLTAFKGWLSTQLPEIVISLFFMLDFAVSIMVISCLFAVIFKVLPDVHIRWKEAFYGGIASAVLFSVGEYAMNIYFDVARPQSTFGAAGSMVLLMLWMSYSCLILLLGASFTKVFGEYLLGAKAPLNELAQKA